MKQDPPNSPSPLFHSPVLRLLLAALLGILVGVAVLIKMPHLFEAWANKIPPGWQATALAMATSTIMAAALGLRGLWPLFALLFPLVAALVAVLNPPFWIYPVILTLGMGIFWNVRGDRVPLYLSNQTTIQAVTDLLPPRSVEQRVVMDLGSGLGDMVVGLAKRRDDIRVIGLETAPLSYALSKLRLILSTRQNAEILWRDIWAQDLGEADIVYAFLSTQPMTRLLRQARKQMRPGTMLISNSFVPKDDAPNSVIELKDGRKTQLFVWYF